ncbi:MAG: ABC transporter substrate-binding protein, partial [Hyphomicrobiales bacterium]|nr:ABC transporter substrate-binding protein [Hyphomicrobiales bacterium]
MWRPILIGAWLLASIAASPAAAQIREAQGLSLLDAPALARGFAHFPYVNPNAPKGGTVRIAALGSFDSLNGFLIKGNAAEGLGLIYDTLMTPSLDEPASVYGLIAHHVSAPADLSSATFVLRRAARFHDGTPITADDVAFSLTALKAHHPSYHAYYKDVVRAEIVSPHQVRFHFAEPNNRELPFIIAQLPILPKHYWAEREFDKTTLEPPLGSGPYKI